MRFRLTITSGRYQCIPEVRLVNVYDAVGGIALRADHLAKMG
jgi:hypothetical protein